MTHSMLSHYSYPTPHGPITICTSERLPYGCIILQKGVM